MRNRSITLQNLYRFRPILILALLSGAYVFQAMGHQPCSLCLIQRWILVTLLPFAILAAVFWQRFRKSHFFLVGCMTLLCLLGLLVSMRHLWLIYHPSATDTCIPDLWGFLSNQTWGQRWQSLFHNDLGCGEEQTKFLGLFLPVWLVLYYSFHWVIDLLAMRQVSLHGSQNFRGNR